MNATRITIEQTVISISSSVKPSNTYPFDVVKAMMKPIIDATEVISDTEHTNLVKNKHIFKKISFMIQEFKYRINRWINRRDIKRGPPSRSPRYRQTPMYEDSDPQN